MTKADPTRKSDSNQLLNIHDEFIVLVDIYHLLFSHEDLQINPYTWRKQSFKFISE